MKTKIKITPELTEFLEGKGVLNQFIYNCQNHSIYVHTEINTDISCAFVFNKTPEGQTFWLNLADEFEKEQE